MTPVDENRPDREEASLAELAERLSGRITTALVLAAAILGLAIYSRPAPPRYEAVVGDGKIVRIDTRSGTIISCDAEGCAAVLREGAAPQAEPEPQASAEAGPAVRAARFARPDPLTSGVIPPPSRTLRRA